MMDRTDDYANTMTALGSQRDRTNGTTFQRRSRLSRLTLEALYEQSAIAARLVDKLADDAFSTGWGLSELRMADGAPEPDLGQVMSDLDDLRVNSTLKQASKWEHLYGGALVLLPTTDPAPTNQPLGRFSELYPLAVVPAHQAVPVEWDAALGSRTFQQTLIYDVMTFTQSVQLHHTRCIPFEYVALPPEALLTSPTRWGPSVLDRVFTELGRMGEALRYSNGMLYMASIMTLKLEHFRKESLSAGGKERLQEILRTMRQSMDSLSLLGLDTADDLAVTSHTMAGVHEIIAKAVDALAAAAPMPREILLNESPAGLNAGQLSGPQELWLRTVGGYRESKITPALDRILELYFQSRGIRAVGWSVEWEPLWIESDASRAAISTQLAQSDAIYLDQGVLSPEQVHQHRFVDGRQDPIQVTPEAPAEPLDLSTDAPPSEASPAFSGMPLDSAQITTLVGLVAQVQSGTLPRDAAIGIIGVAFPALRGREATVLGSAGVAAAPAAEEEGLVQSPHAPPPGERLETPGELVDDLGVSAAVIRGMHRRGEIDGWQIGSRWRYLRSQILAAGHRPGTPPEPA